MVLEQVALQIVRAVATDIPALAAMNKRLIEDEGHPNPMDVAQLADRMAGFLSGEYTAFVARQGAETVGYALYRDDGGCYYLRHLYVERGHRRQGIAKALLDWLFGHAWVDKPVRLEVLAHNEDAIAFYRAYGFRVTSHTMEMARAPRQP